MPLKLNAGLSRKVADGNYGSKGASVNVELEVESSIIDEPGKLKERIKQVFGIVRSSLVEELNGNSGQQSQAHQPSSSPPQNGNGAGNGHQNGTPRPATKSQVKAIQSICRNKGIDLTTFLNNRFHVGRPDDLNIKTASAAIDELKNGG